MTKLRVKAALVDVRRLTLYLEDGSKYVIPQGNLAIQAIVDAVIPYSTKGLITELDLADFISNPYADYEEKSGGVVKLFRVAKKFVTNIFRTKEEKEAEATKHSVFLRATASSPIAVAAGLPDVSGVSGGKAVNAISEIMAQATPIQKGESDALAEGDTVIAVVDGKVIPGVEALKNQFEHFAKTNSKGLENFLKRIATVIDDRGHSVEDLLRFMEKGDLPLADDGSIIAYKILNNDSRRGKGYFLDCHSGKVSQRVGSYVVVDLSLVDTNRRNECSNGLHIARRGYLGSFGGNVCTLCKIAPEDVVTVPHNDANKIRVMGYHILGLLSRDDFQKLKANKHMTDGTEAAKLLTSAMRGEHIERIEEVRITQQHGGGLQIKALKEGYERSSDREDTSKTNAVETRASAPSQDAKALDSTKAISNADVKAISKTVAEKKAVTSGSSSKKDKVIALIADVKSAKNEKAATTFYNEILNLKKTSKTSWEKLGTTQIEINSLNPTRTVEMKPTPAKAAAKPVKAAASKEPVAGKPIAIDSKVSSKPKVKSSDRTKAAKSATPTTTLSSKVQKSASYTLAKAKAAAEPKKASASTDSTVKPKKLTTKEEARQFFDKKDWSRLKALKASAKVSWFKLGFSAKEEAEILKR